MKINFELRYRSREAERKMAKNLLGATAVGFLLTMGGMFGRIYSNEAYNYKAPERVREINREITGTLDEDLIYYNNLIEERDSLTRIAIEEYQGRREQMIRERDYNVKIYERMYFTGMAVSLLGIIGMGIAGNIKTKPEGD